MPDAAIAIVNCSTKEQTTLALASAIAHTALPVTVVDCDSTDGSYVFFRRLQQRLDFRLEQMPLARHGDTLDRLFGSTARGALLLLDSDAEILRADLVPRMLTALAEGAWGAGFVHRGQWLADNHLVAGNVGYYAPRPWIPCVLLAAGPIRNALARGVSFRAGVVCNEVPQWPLLARLLYLRFRLPGLARIRLDGLVHRRREHFGVRPHYVYYDTGATIFEHFAQEGDGQRFADLGDDYWPLAVRHYHGVTRRTLSRWMRNAADVSATRREAIERIETIYGIAVPELRSGA